MFTKRKSKVSRPEDRLQACADKKLIFDCHCHYFNYRQQTQGIQALVRAMQANGIGFAALSGCAFKKTWMQSADPAPIHHLYDDGDLYYCTWRCTLACAALLP